MVHTGGTETVQTVFYIPAFVFGFGTVFLPGFIVVSSSNNRFASNPNGLIIWCTQAGVEDSKANPTPFPKGALANARGGGTLRVKL